MTKNNLIHAFVVSVGVAWAGSALAQSAVPGTLDSVADDAFAAAADPLYQRLNMRRVMSGTIRIDGVISDETLARVSVLVPYLDKKLSKDKPLTVEINSYGGDYFVGRAIYDILKSLDRPVVTRCQGIAASSAFIIFMAGNEREVLPGCILMNHAPYTGVDNGEGVIQKQDTIGLATDPATVSEKRLTEMALEKDIDEISATVNLPPETIRKMFYAEGAGECYMTAAFAMEHRFATAVLGARGDRLTQVAPRDGMPTLSACPGWTTPQAK